jgi:prepilin-type N-terminal cleavage/methylation domain-containing protein/prepilin-type processing-associated H-X9-DG protein
LANSRRRISPGHAPESAPPSGFSLVELLVVIGVIGLLLALLLPVIGSVRRAANATKCLANVHQWAQAYQMYLSANRGRSFVLGDMPTRMDLGNNPPMWWEILQPHQPDAVAGLLCPEASEAANVTPKDAFHAWGPERFWDTPTKIRGAYVGSYGFNSWLYQPTNEDNRMPEHLRLPTKQGDKVPVVFDCARLDIPVLDTDPPALYGVAPANGAKAGSMRWAALERHKDGINVAFLDGHADHVSAAGLWELKWSEQFTPRKVTIQR